MKYIRDLSQDEIDALLHGVDDVEEEEVGGSDSDAKSVQRLARCHIRSPRTHELLM